jgi:hypothetical protein
MNDATTKSGIDLGAKAKDKKGLGRKNARNGWIEHKRKFGLEAKATWREKQRQGIRAALGGFVAPRGLTFKNWRRELARYGREAAA